MSTRIDVAMVEEELGLARPIAWRALGIQLGLVGGLGVVVLAGASSFWPRGSDAAQATVGAAAVLLLTGLALALPKRHAAEVPSVTPGAEEDGILLGVTEDRKKVIWPTKLQSRGCLLVGAPGGGKSQLGILDMAYEKMLRGGSLVVVDAKPENRTREIYLYLARKAGRLDDVRMLIPDEPHWSHTFNPIPRREMTVEQQVDVLTGLRAFANSATTLYYSDSQYSAIAGVVSALYDLGRDYHPGDVLACMTSPVAREKLLGLKATPGAEQLVMAMADYRKGGAFDEEKWMNELKGLIVILRKYLRSAAPILLHERSEIDIYDALTDGGIVYVQLPSGQSDEMATSWARLVLNCLLAACGKMIREGNKPDEPGLAIFDEFARYATQKGAAAFAWTRASDTGLVAGFQSASQLREAKLEDLVMDNTAYKVFFSHNGDVGATAAAEQIGKRPQLRVSYSVGNSEGKSTRAQAGGGLSTSKGQSVSVSGREDYDFVVKPHELRGLPVGTAYATWGGEVRKVKTPHLQIDDDDLIDVRRSLGLPKAGDPGCEGGNQRYGERFDTRGRKGVGFWDTYQADMRANLGRYKALLAAEVDRQSGGKEKDDE